MKFNIGDSVLATAKPGTTFDFDFIGTVIECHPETGLYVIEDQDSNCFLVEESQLQLDEQ